MSDLALFILILGKLVVLALWVLIGLVLVFWAGNKMKGD